MYLFGVGDHPVELLDASDSLWWLLEQALPDVGHHSLVLPDLGWNTDECAELWWQINVLALLANFKKWLINGVNFHAISSSEVINHVGPCFLIAVVEDVLLWIHIPLDLVDFVGPVRTVLGHDDGSFKLSVDKICIVSQAPIIYKG